MSSDFLIKSSLDVLNAAQKEQRQTQFKISCVFSTLSQLNTWQSSGCSVAPFLNLLVRPKF
jgi:hypothetical protein